MYNYVHTYLHKYFWNIPDDIIKYSTVPYQGTVPFFMIENFHVLSYKLGLFIHTNFHNRDMIIEYIIQISFFPSNRHKKQDSFAES